MASPSSREAALERRKALTSGGKKSAGRYSSGPNRVRSAEDARPTRTNMPVPISPVSSAPVYSEPTPSRSSRPSRMAEISLAAPVNGMVSRSSARPIANPSRELVLARREALSRRGKRADTSRDRTRNEEKKASATVVAAAPAKEHKCKCQES
ncbi:MAG: carboxysome shell protein, partial [Synechococcaceae cyanobacterium ELA182]